MSDDEQLIARLEERVKSLTERATKLESNQKYVVFGIAGAVIKALFDVIQNGGTP